MKLEGTAFSVFLRQKNAVVFIPLRSQWRLCRLPKLMRSLPSFSEEMMIFGLNGSRVRGLAGNIATATSIVPD